MKRQSSARHFLFIAAAFLFAVTMLSPAAAYADDGSQLAKEMDNYGIRPAAQGEQAVTGQTVDRSFSFLSHGREGTYVIHYKDDTTEEVSYKEFSARYPVFSGVILGGLPAASNPPTYYAGPANPGYLKIDQATSLSGGPKDPGYLKTGEPASIQAGPADPGYLKTGGEIGLKRPYIHGNVMNWSGSSRFGDDIGADYHPYFGFPGEPAGGKPIGRWINFGRENAQISNDSLLLNALSNNDMSTFNSLFRGQFDGDPIEEKFGDARAF